MNTLTTTQPTGIRAFGWGLLGYMGGTFLMNTIMAIALMIIAAGGTDVWGLLAFPGLGIGIYATYKFGKSREYESTTAGANIAIAFAVITFVGGMFRAF